MVAFIPVTNKLLNILNLPLKIGLIRSNGPDSGPISGPLDSPANEQAIRMARRAVLGAVGTKNPTPSPRDAGYTKQ